MIESISTEGMIAEICEAREVSAVAVWPVGTRGFLGGLLNARMRLIPNTTTFDFLPSVEDVLHELRGISRTMTERGQA